MPSPINHLARRARIGQNAPAPIEVNDARNDMEANPEPNPRLANAPVRAGMRERIHVNAVAASQAGFGVAVVASVHLAKKNYDIGLGQSQPDPALTVVRCAAYSGMAIAFSGKLLAFLTAPAQTNLAANAPSTEPSSPEASSGSSCSEIGSTRGHMNAGYWP